MHKKSKKPKEVFCEGDLGQGISFHCNGSYPTVVSFRKKLSSHESQPKQISYSFINPDDCRELAKWFKKAANYLESFQRKDL